MTLASAAEWKTWWRHGVGKFAQERQPQPAEQALDFWWTRPISRNITRLQLVTAQVLSERILMQLNNFTLLASIMLGFHRKLLSFTLQGTRLLLQSLNLLQFFHITVDQQLNLNSTTESFCLGWNLQLIYLMKAITCHHLLKDILKYSK